MPEIISFIAGLQNTPVPLLIIALGGFFLFLALVPKIGKIINAPQESRKWLAIVGGVLLLSAGGIYLVHPIDKGNVVLPNSTSQAQSLANSVYSFEDGSMGWVAQDYEDSRACVQVEWSNEAAEDGQYSLKLFMELIGGDTQYSKGEAWVNLLDNPPAGKTIPADLTNRTISMWVYAPQESKGDRKKSNGFQIFVKDENWNSEYGTWSNVVEGQWVKITLTVSASKPEDGYMDQGFDPSRIIAVGIKMGAGGGSTAKFIGVIYVDAVDW